MSARIWRLLAVGVVSISLACLGRVAIMGTPVGNAGDARAIRSVREAGRAIRPLHRGKTPPQPGEWLDKHPEAGQTFDVYLESEPNRPTAVRTTIYVQPLGTFSPSQQKLLDATSDLLGRFYNVPVKSLPPIGLDVIPDKARRVHPTWDVPQILSTHVLGLLKKRRPADAVAVLALTTSDLWPGEGWNFVFGQASLNDRVGVWSLARNGDPVTEYPLCLSRTLKTALHETGHMLGIPHCTAYECGMNGSNHEKESDSRPTGFCPEDEMKIWWACRADPARRYERLVEFAEANGLREEARSWKAALAALRPATNRDQPSTADGTTGGRRRP